MQSIEMNLKTCSWDGLCQTVVARFERDQQNLVIRQFFHVKQTGSVTEYVELFDEIVHKLLAHDPFFNPSAITSKFVDGLKSEIKAVVLVHRPKDLDTACSLAILREEVLQGSSTREMRRGEGTINVKAYSKMNVGPPSAKSMDSVVIDERKSSGFSRVRNQNEKVSALMAYRKAKGFCFKCMTKWGPQHTCAENVPLHYVEELWQMLDENEGNQKQLVELRNSDSEDDLMAISAQVVNGTSTGKTVRFLGSLYSHRAVILVDSGSSHNFISEQMAAALPNWKALDQVMKVKVADGAILHCTHELVDCPWIVQGVTFRTTFKILPLKCYDAILGMDWLVQHSPMQI